MCPAGGPVWASKWTLIAKKCVLPVGSKAMVEPKILASSASSARALTWKKGTNWVLALPAVVLAWHETTGPSGYTPNEFFCATPNRAKEPPLADPRAVAQGAVHYFQNREELHAPAHRAMSHLQKTMANKYN